MTAQNSRALERRAMLKMMLCAFLWSIAGIFIKWIDWNPIVIAGFRSLLAGLVTLIYMRVKGFRFVISGTSVIGAVFMALTFFAFVGANKLTTAANAIVLQYTQPVFILIISAIFFKKRFSRADLVAVAFTLAGISLFFFDQLSPGHMLGNCVAIGAGASMAVMFVVVEHVGVEERFSATLLGHSITAIVGLPFILFTENSFTALSFVNIVVLGVLQLGIAYLLFVEAVAHCPALVCSLLGTIEPLCNPVWVFLLDGERPGVFALLGGVVVIATITIWCIWRDRRQTV